MAEIGFAPSSPTTIPTVTTGSPDDNVAIAGRSVAPAQVAAQTPLSATTTQQNAQLSAQSDIRVRLAPLNPSAVYNSAAITPSAVNQTIQSIQSFLPSALSSTISSGVTSAASGLSSLLSAAQASAPLWNALQQTNGMLFPYTPTINFSQAVNYADLQLVHSNTDYAAYVRTPSVTISISGKFTVQNQAEGIYSLACIHFLRTVSKSYFGANDTNAGLPPPILVLNGYGNYIFNNLAVILKSHSWTFDDSADGIDIVFGNNRARLPALFTISCELMAVQTPQRMRNEFTFNRFASGQLMQVSSTPGWI